MKHVLLNLLLLSNLCHGMEPQNFKDIANLNDFESHMIRTDADIVSLHVGGKVAEIIFQTRPDKKNSVQHTYTARFIRNYSKDGIIYLAPLYEDAQEQTPTESSVWNYQLLFLAKNGHSELIDETLEHGAHPLAPDHRLTRPLFNLSTQTLGTPLYTREDLQNSRPPFRLLQSTRPVIAVHPYSNTYNLTAIDHAIRQCSLSALKRLQKICEAALPEDVLKRIHHDIKLNELLKKVGQGTTYNTTSPSTRGDPHIYYFTSFKFH